MNLGKLHESTSIEISDTGRSERKTV